MNWRKAFLIAYVAAQALLLVAYEVGYRGAMLAGLFLGLSLIPGRFTRLNRWAHLVILVTVGLAFLLAMIVRFDNERNVLDIFALFAECLLVVQGLEVWRTSQASANDLCVRQSTQNYVPGLGAITLALTILSLDSTITNDTLAVIFTVFFVMLIGILRPDLPRISIASKQQRNKAVALFTIAIVSWGAGKFFGKEITRELPTVQQYLLQFRNEERGRIIANVRAKFVDRVELSSIARRQLDNPEDPVYTVNASRPPGYMRTLTFEQFDGQRWFNPWERSRQLVAGDLVQLNPTNETPPELGDAVLQELSGMRFRLPGEASAETGLDVGRMMTVRVPVGRGLLTPLPVRAGLLIGQVDRRLGQLMLDKHGNIFPGAFQTREYVVFPGPFRNFPAGESYLEEMSEQTGTDKAWIQELSDRICDGQSTRLDKIRAVESYLANNFGYSLTSDPAANSGNRSALRAFLEDKLEAHCEYFATASVLLLRAQGIPCRLSVGYLTFEMNEGEDYFVAHNRNAHAWAEAYDAVSRQWVIVESTPGTSDYIAEYADDSVVEGLLETASDDTVDEARFGLLGRLMETIGRFQRWMSSVSTSRFFWLFPALLALTVLAVRLRRNELRRRATGSVISASVRRADQRAQRLGFERRPDETCHQFAQRLQASAKPGVEPLASWYAGFADHRYRVDAPEQRFPPPPKLRWRAASSAHRGA